MHSMPNSAATYKKLNCGCGNRFAPGWINVDFNTIHPDVICHNLLRPLPFEDGYFDVVYCSQVLEHFSRENGKKLIREGYRVLKPGGIIRLTVPDLEQSCREYIRILDTIESDPISKKQYEWIIIELLDQMVRIEAGGLIIQYWKEIVQRRASLMIDYVEKRTSERIREIFNSNRCAPPRKLKILSNLRYMNFRRIRRGLYGLCK